MLRLIRSDCGGNRDCPNINRADNGCLVVVGYRTERAKTVRVPATLAPEWDTPALRDGDNLLITGRALTDPDILAELKPASDEAVIVLLEADLPTLEIAAC